ncbi:MAG: hypothetical protein IT560_00915 [Alphaproteobacteria bacterium]|nr:hypothetical protein [Alphaproteobacteria bacterium]
MAKSVAKKPAAAKAIKKASGAPKRSASRKARSPAKLSTRRPASSPRRAPQPAADTSFLSMLAHIFGVAREAPRKNMR